MLVSVTVVLETITVYRVVADNCVTMQVHGDLFRK